MWFLKKYITWFVLNVLTKRMSELSLKITEKKCLVTYSHQPMGENLLRAVAKVTQKNLCSKHILKIRSTINISSVVFTYSKKLSQWFSKQSHFCVQPLALLGILLIKRNKSIVNNLIKTIEAIRQDLIQTTSNKDS